MPREQLGELEQQVLIALLHAGPKAYSVPIVEALEERTGREVATAAVYIVLRRLEEKGLVRSALGPPEAAEGGRDRRYFTMTPQGMKRLREVRTVWRRLWDGVDPMLG